MSDVERGGGDAEKYQNEPDYNRGIRSHDAFLKPPGNQQTRTSEMLHPTLRALLRPHVLARGRAWGGGRGREG